MARFAQGVTKKELCDYRGNREDRGGEGCGGWSGDGVSLRLPYRDGSL